MFRPTLTGCCGCFTLQTGTCILAIYLIIINALNFTSLGYNLSISDGTVRHLYNPYPGFVVSGLDMFMGLVGLIGAAKRVASVVKVFAIWMVIRVVAAVGFGITNFYFLYNHGFECTGSLSQTRTDSSFCEKGLLPSFIIRLAISIVFGVYFAMVVWSFHREIVPGNQEPNIELGYTAPAPAAGGYAYAANQAPQQPWSGQQYQYEPPPPSYGQEQYAAPPQYVQK